MDCFCRDYCAHGWCPPTLAAFKFAGFEFFFSLLLLWILIQGLVWLAERYSNVISGVQWWRSAILGLIATIVMVLTWGIPKQIMGGEGHNLVHAMTSGMVFGGIASWFLCGRLYRFDSVHRIVIAIGVPILVVCALAFGQIWLWKLTGR